MATNSSAQQRRRSRRRAAIVLVPTVAGVFVAGTAFAYWSTSGTGTGSATTGTSAVVTVTQTSTVSNLVPGGPVQPITFSINNPKSTNQYVAGVSIAITAITVGGNPAVGCTAADFTIVDPNPIVSDLIPGPTAFNSQGSSIVMKNTNSNQDGCKNATLTLSFTAI